MSNTASAGAVRPVQCVIAMQKGPIGDTCNRLLAHDPQRDVREARVPMQTRGGIGRHGVPERATPKSGKEITAENNRKERGGQD